MPHQMSNNYIKENYDNLKKKKNNNKIKILACSHGN